MAKKGHVHKGVNKAVQIVQVKNYTFEKEQLNTQCALNDIVRHAAEEDQ